MVAIREIGDGGLWLENNGGGVGSSVELLVSGDARERQQLGVVCRGLVARGYELAVVAGRCCVDGRLIWGGWCDLIMVVWFGL